MVLPSAEQSLQFGEFHGLAEHRQGGFGLGRGFEPGIPRHEDDFGVRTGVLYCEKIRVFKAGFSLEYISME